MSNYIISGGELYHYGVKGMKWGHRKARYESERNAYKAAKKNLRDAKKEVRKNSRFAYGSSRMLRLNDSNDKVKKAELSVIDTKAKYKGAKSKNSEKAEFKTYVREMKKNGLVGSGADAASGGKSKALYDHLKVNKGKAYADKVHKSVSNRLIVDIAASAAVVAGSAYIASRMGY